LESTRCWRIVSAIGIGVTATRLHTDVRTSRTASAVARPGDQIDRNVNSKLIPTGGSFGENFDATTEQTRPRPGLRDNGFWAHGLNVGIEFRY